MAMTKQERIAKEQIIDILGEEGHPTYAKLLSYFDINLTADPNVIGYMIPQKAVIVLNKGLDTDQVSVVVRHEILHEYFTHFEKAKKLLNKETWDELTQQALNVAGDYDISNRGYTEEDKKTIRRLILNGHTLSGLVTEDEHPDWVSMSFEEMFELMNKDIDKFKDFLEQLSKMSFANPDQAIQDAEQAEREANAVRDEISSGSGSSKKSGKESDKEKDGKEGQESSNNSDKGDKESNDNSTVKSAQGGHWDGHTTNDKIVEFTDELIDEIEQAKKKAQSIKNEQAKEDRVFADKQEQAEIDSLAKRLTKIKEILSSAEFSKGIFDEINRKKDEEAIEKSKRELEKYKKNPLVQFRNYLNNFIRNEIAVGRGPTWTRFNKKYSGSGLLKPGSSRLQQNKVPLINVYFDISGSVQPYIKSSRQVLSVLNDLVRQGKIKVDLYYVSSYISRTERGDGTGANGAAIMNNINKTKPDNVVIITDSDANYGLSGEISVPGGVFYICPDASSLPDELMERVRGKKATKTFIID